MSRVPHQSVRTVATCPAVAGFRPHGAALAVAAAFALQPAAGLAQPSGAQVIHGQASMVRNGSNLTVTTQNGAGTSHSAINWQSFSIPAGSTTRFNQPSVSSTSINRVLGSDPSAIFGTLSSNGRLVLVNPAGIAVGAGAVVDTAGFTASTLGMSDMDALTGRMRFSGGGGPLTVDGKIVTTSGDVVLIAPKLQTGAQALIESQGATILAAGQKVELTGRGLEGIVMEVQAGNEAVNLGAIKGDAVGVFAGTLKHSGLVQAQAVSTQGGKVVLKATGGDAMVDGTVIAASGSKGGSIDVLGERVGLLAGARLLANGVTGGGNVRVGGDYQGLNPGVPNAKRTYVDAQARIEANATAFGNGGRVIVWSDELTKMHGRISARGGAFGGHGGFAEVSGKQTLQYTGRTDLRAPRGRAGTLLLDPNDINIVHSEEPEGSNTTRQDSEFSGGPDLATVTDYDLNEQLALGNVVVTTSSSSSAGGNITLMPDAVVLWSTPHSLSLLADKSISIQGTIDAASSGASLFLVADEGNVTGNGTIRVHSLYVSANNPSAAPDAGRVRLEGDNNMVSVLAGRAAGLGAEFVFKNNQALTIGSAGGHSGIEVTNQSGEYAGTLSITAQGTITVNPSAYISGGNITLLAQGAEADVLIDNVDITGSGGVSLIAGRNVLINTLEDYQYSAHIHGDEFLFMKAEQDVIVAPHNPTDGGAVTWLTSNGQVEILAGGNVSMSHNDDELAASVVHVRSGHGGEPMRGVVIHAGSGDVDFGLATDVLAIGGPIDVFAKGSIRGSGSFQNYGGARADDPLGSVTLTAEEGSVSFGSIRTNPSYGPWGGNVTVSAASGIAGGTIDASGTSSGSDASFGAGSGGTVSLHSAGGNITMGVIESAGYQPSYGSGTGGAGGKVFVTADTGNITFVAGIYASGSNGTSGGGQGGEVTVSAGGNAVIPQIQVLGGGSLGGTIQGGKGGKVDVSAGGDVTMVSPVGFSIYADGGFSAGGVGGEGGTVVVTAGGSVTAYAPPPAPAPTSAPPGPADSLNSGFSAIGGTGSPGGRGGKVTVNAGADVNVASIEVDGGAGRSNSGAAGGRGGDAVVNFGGILNMMKIFAAGGQGGNAFAANAGQGGRGGTITLIRSSGPFVLGSGLRLDATGGRGGTAAAGEGGPPTQPWLGGAGGDGGAVLLGAANGELTLQSPQVLTEGGAGGTNSASTSASQPGSGASGAIGDFGAAGTAVNIDGDFVLNANWTNESVVNIGGSSHVSGLGNISNKGVFNLSGTASVDPDGGFVNQSAGKVKVSGSGSDVYVDLRSNAGLLEVDAGTRLSAIFFGVNTGTVVVDGTLNVNDPDCPTCEGSAFTPDGGEFENAGTIAGNGTMIVTGGTGTIVNQSGGVIAPGRVGEVGTLTLQAALVMESGSLYKVDIGPNSAVDLLRANSVVAGGGLEIAPLSNASYNAGALFDILQANQIDTTALPTLDGSRFDLLPSSTALKVVAKQQFPAPAPAPISPPVGQPPAGPPPSDVQQVQNEVINFAKLFILESERQGRRSTPIGQDNIVLTDTACTP